MPPRKSLPRSSAASSTRSSPRSTRSTPQRKAAATPLKSETSTPRKSASSTNAKTSPYFRKGKTVAVESDEDGEEDEREASPSGMTESSSSSEDDESEDAFDPPSDDEDEEEEEEEIDEPSDEDYDSDNLDDESQVKSKGKRKSLGGTNGSSTSKKAKSGKKTNGTHAPIEGYEDDDEDEEEVELEDGQEIAGRIYPAPKTGQVPPGRISQNTLNFLKNLQIPQRNDRDWFRSHEPAYRQAEKEWKAFVGLVQVSINEVDPEVPVLPPKDVIHRIYRDVRFSSDKTPYKKSFSLSTSRGGRKGNWAAYHLSISPNNRSILACGIWQPDKNITQSVRHSFLTRPERFRKEISRPEFVKLFGPARPHPKGQRQNVFGHDDALKVAPKGMDKEHKDIDLLKLRSIAVVHSFSDEEVLSEDFRDKIAAVVGVMAPFVHLLNDMITLPDENADEEEEEGNADEDEEGDDDVDE